MDTANIGRDVVLNVQKSAEASVVTAEEGEERM